MTQTYQQTANAILGSFKKLLLVAPNFTNHHSPLEVEKYLAHLKWEEKDSQRRDSNYSNLWKKSMCCKLTWYMDRYKTQRHKNTTLSRRASNSIAPRLSAAPIRHSSSIAVCVSKPSRGPSHSRVGEDSSCSPRGLPLYRSCQRAGNSPSLP